MLYTRLCTNSWHRKGTQLIGPRKRIDFKALTYHISAYTIDNNMILPTSSRMAHLAPIESITSFCKVNFSLVISVLQTDDQVKRSSKKLQKVSSNLELLSIAYNVCIDYAE